MARRKFPDSEHSATAFLESMLVEKKFLCFNRNLIYYFYCVCLAGIMTDVVIHEKRRK